jgi:hypothetical protein
MTLFFSKHALQRCLERGITEKMVKAVYADPAVTIRGDTSGVRLQKQLGKRFITVVVEVKGKHAIVITAY